jgi:hypothetical protein
MDINMKHKLHVLSIASLLMTNGLVAEDVVEVPQVKDTEKKTSLPPYAFGIVSSFHEQELESNIDASNIDEQTWKAGVQASMIFDCDKRSITVQVSASHQESEFEYRNNQAKLNVEGYNFGLELGYAPKHYPKFHLSSGLNFSDLEGRDFVDNLGGVGLTEKAKLKSLEYFIIPSYEVWSHQHDQGNHSLRARAGWMDREWEMNIGWTTNDKEKMNNDNGWLLGLEYKWKSESPQYKNYEVMSKFDLLNDGYQANLALDFNF